MELAIRRGVGHASATFDFSPNFSLVYIEFCQFLFSRSEQLTYYALKYDNLKSVEVQGQNTQNTDIFALNVETYFHYASRKMPCYFTLNGCAEKPREM